MENLAPAGNPEALERADAAGADAVYLGYSAFSARAGAGNFNRQELEEAIRYAHLRHMRVYVTVNTLVKDAELRDVTEVLRLLRDLRADGVLVQDLGVLRIARNLFPGLAVHASTQMAIHNRTGVMWCAAQGMRRVVLARECSLDEIRRCAGNGPEIEVFAHGAQCVAVSGLCLFSSMVGERSGNRGRCAQPCRKEYCFRGRWGAWLSPRDISLRDELPKLEAAGVASLKLEGRLKRPEYVAVVTESYRRGLDSLAAGEFAPADGREREGLLQVFNRGGFMTGYALGCEDAGVIDPAGPGHRGIRIGKIMSADGRLARVKLEKDLHDGDGLSLRGGREENGLVYAGPDRKAGETAVLRLRPESRVRAGDEAYRLTDARQTARARALPGRKVKADLFLRAMPGENLVLTATDGESTVSVAGGIAEPARTRAVSGEELIRNLRKTGGTVFVPGEIRTETKDAFVPVSALNALRREALEKLAGERIAAFEPDTAGEGKPPETELPRGSLPPMAYVRTAAQAQAAREAGMRVIRCPEDFRAEAMTALADEMRPGDWIALPDVCGEDTLREWVRWTDRNRSLLGGVVLGSVGQLGADWRIRRAAGPGIPVMNRQAAALLLREGCEFVTASPELTGSELSALTEGGVPVTVTVYGRTRLMLLHHCPARTALGLKSGHRDCRLCDEGAAGALAGQVLEDRMGHRFPLLRQRLPEGCLVQLMNAVPTDVIGPAQSFMNRGGKPDGNGFFPAVILTDEDEKETREVLNAFREGGKVGRETTAGHWRRPVE